MSTKKEYLRLIEEIREHDQHYYQEARPVISDYEYDQLVKLLEKIEKEHPDWITPSSPTQRVGEALTKGFKQVAHHVPMMSLANTYSREELEDFIKRVHKLLERSDVSFCAELKMDGVAVSVRYENGIYVRAVTRGDGRKGDDITGNMKTIANLPLELKSSHPPEVLEIRGEVFMSHRVFNQQNADKEERGEELWANPRNAAAGSLKLLDPKVVLRRKLSTVFYGIAEVTATSVRTQIECHDFLKKLGLPAFEERHRKLCHSVDEILKFADKIEKERRSLPFDIDGIVVKVNEFKYYDILGFTGKSPRFAVAYKFAPEQALTQIDDIWVNVGRTGVLTPVAELKPVFLAGSTIARASLHNQEEVERKDIRVGDWVIIEKGVDITRELMEAIRDLPSLCEFVHFPIQAGSNRILKKMHRMYTIEQYLEKVALLREIVPNVTLGTDIIVGFPTETEEEFQLTYDIFKQIGYSVGFLFAYSARKGTPAFRWVDDIPEEVKQERLQRLLGLYAEMCSEQRQQMLDTETEVLVERYNKDEQNLKGRTRCWKNVVFKGTENMIGTLQKVQVKGYSHQTLLGEIQNSKCKLQFELKD